MSINEQQDQAEFLAEAFTSLDVLARALRVPDARLQPTLDAIVSAACVLSPGQDAGLILLSRGTLMPQAATGRAPRLLDLLQQKAGQGPCIEAARQQAVIRIEDTRHDVRWPDFCAAAQGYGIRSLLCAPLWVDERCLGTFSLYGEQPAIFTRHHERITILFATLAALAVAEAQRADQLRAALDNRDFIGQAKGILMHRDAITAEAAFACLGQVSQHTNTKLVDVARHLAETGELASVPVRRTSRERAGMSRPAVSTRVGFIGVGRMGLPMCANLVRAGYDVTAGDVREELQAAVTACGARWGGPGPAVAAAADVLITMLPGGPELRELMLAPGGVLAALPEAATWIDMTSTSPVIGRVLGRAARARGVEMLEAPVGGGVRAAVAGSLLLFVGGDAELLQRHRTLLEALADPGRIILMGGRGAGYTTKHLVNLLWFGQAIATAEALLLARREDIDLGILRRALVGSAASSSFIRHDLSALFDGDYLTSFGLDRCCEELSAITALARQDGVPFELSEQVERTYQRALARYGPAAGELLPVAMLEEQAGVQLRDPA